MTGHGNACLFLESIKYQEGKMVNLLLVAGLIFVVLWLLGLITSYTLGGYVHIVLVIALICIAVWLVRYVIGRRR
jgi:hypothetical protein